MMMTLDDVLQTLADAADSKRDKGARFEALMRRYFLTSKKYQPLIETVWLWSDFPWRDQLGGQDTGIDLVVLDTDGQYWAVQCKFYGTNTYVSKGDVDTFIATASRTFRDQDGTWQKFSRLFFISTSTSLSDNVRRVFQNQSAAAVMLFPGQLAADTSVDWEQLLAGKSGREARARQVFQPRSYQQAAINAAHAYFQDHDRGKLIMACGTGKTYTALCIAERETDRRGLVLVCVPSIALVNQILNDWTSASTVPLYPVCVCSDSSASRRRDQDESDLSDLHFPACTDPESVASHIRACREKEGESGDTHGLIVVFTTYQSIDVVSRAQDLLQKGVEDAALFHRPTQPRLAAETAASQISPDYTFDLIVCDEAHRTTGVKIKGRDESSFTKIHDNAIIVGRRRLYMTATPRLYSPDVKKKASDADVLLCSMDNEKVYGQEIYRIGFGEAVEKGILTDYKVLVLTVPETAATAALLAFMEKDREITTNDAARLVGAISALSKRVSPHDHLLATDPHPMHKAVAFCSTIAQSKHIAAVLQDFSDTYRARLPEEQRDGLIRIAAQHVDGAMSADRREDKLQWLKRADEGEALCRILTNVRCLSEGVDVPSLDGIIFFSSRNSQVDIVQSVGRVMRKSPGKKYGYVIIPVLVPPAGDADKILDKNDDFRTIWSVLQALRSHDDRFNAEVNKLKFVLDKGERPADPTLIIGPGITDPGDETGGDHPLQSLLFEDSLEYKIYVKMVEKVGDRHYWEQWARDVVEIAAHHTERIRQLTAEGGPFREDFDRFVESLRSTMSPAIDEKAAMAMISQHLITRPVFQALFANRAILAQNPVSQAMETFLARMDDETSYEEDQRRLRSFYHSVRLRCEGIDSAAGRQSVIAELYGTFFRTALAREVERLGIVYTPVEVVDFINRSAADLLEKEFGRTLSDEGVHIIDPFTGTGTFLVRLLQQGLITREALPRKYRQELHANEIMLLAYYIASVNIEGAYHDAAGQNAYEPFPGLCLADTFQLYEASAAEQGRIDKLDDPYLAQNSARADAQRAQPMMVILGNPPYSVGQKTANDNAQNEHYPALEARIADTYVAGTSANNKNSLYDSYIKAFRWASDRLGEAGGIIAFVTNAGWLDGQAMDGLRRCFEEEFSSIYVYNLRGDARTKGELRRKEAGNVFGGGSRTPIAITILVKNPAAPNGKAVIHYREVEDYLSRREKLDAVRAMQSAANPRFTREVLHPNEKGDWINLRNDVFDQFIPLGDKKADDNALTFFVPWYSNGLKTNRDPWCYSFSSDKLAQNIQTTIDYYNDTLQTYLDRKNTDVSFEIPIDPKKIVWTDGVKQNLRREQHFTYKAKNLVFSLYRPFCKEWLYYDRQLNERTYQMPKLFPTGREQNLLICVSGIGGSESSLPLMVNGIPDVQIQQNGQCFPLYWYEARTEEGDLFGDAGPSYVRRDGVTDAILRRARTQYKAREITKEDIFYYVYGFLHAPDYRAAFAADLTKSLPRIPLVARYEDFLAFARAGRQLAQIHVNYESHPAPEGVAVERDEQTARDLSPDDLWRVEKLRFGKKNGEKDRSAIVYNGHITITHIPPAVYDYVVNGRSPVEWVMERYQVTTDKASGIRNDPNDWGAEHEDPQYILRLLLSVMTVSLKTQEILKGLPRVEFE